MFANDVTNVINFQNIQIANTAQYKNPIKKWAEDLSRHFSKKRDGQKTMKLIRETKLQ